VDNVLYDCRLAWSLEEIIHRRQVEMFSTYYQAPPPSRNGFSVPQQSSSFSEAFFARQPSAAPRPTAEQHRLPAPPATVDRSNNPFLSREMNPTHFPHSEVHQLDRFSAPPRPPPSSSPSHRITLAEGNGSNNYVSATDPRNGINSNHHIPSSQRSSEWNFPRQNFSW
jgi:hypothetical protein